MTAELSCRSAVVFGGYVALAASYLFAQQAPLTFEVASVRPSTSGMSGVHGGCHGVDSKLEPGDSAPPPLGRCVIADGRLSHMIAMVYRVQSIGHIMGAPDWVMAGDERFTIQAKTENANATEAELWQMMRNLLEDRFRLRYHWETKKMSGFALLVDKNGPHLKAAQGDHTESGFPGGKPGKDTPIHFRARKFSVAGLAQFLTQLGPNPVTDETGLNGLYDFDLNWDETNGPALGTALREQLGLRLQSRVIPVQYFVFESAERPSPN
jgi:uncharacterized protein (TIGR03435 family)